MPGPPAQDNSFPDSTSCAGHHFLSLRLLRPEMLSLPESFLEVVTGRQSGQEGMFPARYGEGVAGSLGGGLAGIALVTFLAFLFQASLQPFVSLSG